MATLASATHGHAALSGTQTQTQPQASREQKAHGPVTQFVRDFIEDILQKPLQASHLAKHDMFREHILAMSISYFALIIVLILVSFGATMYFLQ